MTFTQVIRWYVENRLRESVTTFQADEITEGVVVITRKEQPGPFYAFFNIDLCGFSLDHGITINGFPFLEFGLAIINKIDGVENPVEKATELFLHNTRGIYRHDGQPHQRFSPARNIPLIP